MFFSLGVRASRTSGSLDPRPSRACAVARSGYRVAWAAMATKQGVPTIDQDLRKRILACFDVTADPKSKEGWTYTCRYCPYAKPAKSNTRAVEHFAAMRVSTAKECGGCEGAVPGSLREDVVHAPKKKIGSRA